MILCVGIHVCVCGIVCESCVLVSGDQEIASDMAMPIFFLFKSQDICFFLSWVFSNYM